MGAAEFAFWQDFRRNFGFPEDRLEAVIANIGAYIGGSWGGEAEPDDLIANFGPRKLRAKRLMAAMTSAPGVVSRDGRRRAA